MKFEHGYNRKALAKIAKASGGGQITRDVSFCGTVVFRQRDRVYIEYVPDVCFLIGYTNTNATSLRIIGLAVAREHQHKGIARLLVCRAIAYARKRGFDYIRTRSLDGVDFYQRFGFTMTGMKEDDYLLEYKL